MNNVLVTGSNRGIGLAFVSAYLQRGSRVVATCRQPSQANQLHELQRTYGEALIILPMDVANPQQIAACRRTASAEPQCRDSSADRATR